MTGLFGLARSTGVCMCTYGGAATLLHAQGLSAAAVRASVLTLVVALPEQAHPCPWCLAPLARIGARGR